jgi:hypothetical protein
MKFVGMEQFRLGLEEVKADGGKGMLMPASPSPKKTSARRPPPSDSSPDRSPTVPSNADTEFYTGPKEMMRSSVAPARPVMAAGIVPPREADVRRMAAGTATKKSYKDKAVQKALDVAASAQEEARSLRGELADALRAIERQKEELEALKHAGRCRDARLEEVE